MANLPGISRRALLAGATAIGAVAQLAAVLPAAAQEAAAPVDLNTLERVKVDLLPPPFVHAHEQVATGGPKIVEFTLTIEEKLIEIDNDGTTVWAMTFDGTVPGPLMVVHEGDYVELTLINPDTNMLAHNIDFHAATGALGGAGLTN